MTTIHQTKYTKDLANKRLVVEREFDAPVSQVWRAWTDSDLLEQWWAPKPWKAVTKKMDFREGGSWLYGMNGPEGEIQWCKATYDKIIPQKRYMGFDGFCDENGNINEQMPGMQWDVEFVDKGELTLVKLTVSFASEEDMQKIVEMGFQEGFSAAHDNLDELLAKQN